MRARLAVMVCGLVVTAAAGLAHARERLVRYRGPSDGIDAPIRVLAQDARGFIWIGTEAGVLRWDGQELRRIDPEYPHRVEAIVEAGGTVYVAFSYRDLRRLDGDRLIPVRGPDGEVVTDPTDLAVDPRGQLWVAAGGRVLRGRGGELLPVEGLTGGERAYRIAALRDGSVAIATAARVWRVRGDHATRWLEIDQVLELAETTDGTVWVVDLHARVHEVRGAEVVLRGDWGGQGRGVATRGDVAWVALAGNLVRIEVGRVPELIGPRQGIPSGGPVMVDREGSVWIGSNRGLAQIPMPETVAWNREDGLRTDTTRFLVRTAEGVFVATWGSGWSLVEDAVEDGLALRRVIAGDDANLHNPPCVDRRGVLYGGGARGGIGVREAGAWRSIDLGGPGFLNCVGLERGAIVSVSDGLVVVRDGEARRVQGPLVAGAPLEGRFLHADVRADLWIAGGETICRSPVEEVVAGTARWDCGTIPGMVHATVAVDTPGGALWLGTAQRGILARRPDAGRLSETADAGFAATTGEPSLEVPYIWALERSPRGGVWIGAPGTFWRVDQRPGDPARWHVVEQIDTWQGHLVGGAGDVIEDHDGTLWAATSIGVVEIPPSARFARLDPPAVSITGIRAGGRPVDATRVIALPYGSNSLELTFSGLTYRDPRRLRYRLRLGEHLPWSAASTTPALQLVDLAPGDYVAEIQASFDRNAWTAVPARISIAVADAWWRAPWLWITAALVLAATLVMVHRARVAVRLRLERQRLRIAMDLHDEMGSGLGSIGILANLATTDALADAARRDATGRIATTAGQLGTALTDIVWSLRDETGDLGSLFRYLHERARGLFPADEPALDVLAPPSEPVVVLGLAARRCAQRVALEALTNVARHARARRVWLRAELRGRHIALSIEDDGVGIDPGAAIRPGGGVGLAAMRERAEEIGAVLAVGAGTGGAGTRIELVFDPGADEHRPARGLEHRRART